MSFARRLWIIAGITAAAIIGMMFVPPIPQDPAYHLFADLRSCLGVPNFGNVASNAAFMLVGLAGLAVLYGPNREKPLADTLPFAVFFTGVALVGAGSAYYHLEPNNMSLFWDRLPMTVAFMALTAAVIMDRIHRDAGLKIVLPGLLGVGVVSLVFWLITEQRGAGDLRWYGLVQFLPIMLIPVICWLFPNARYTRWRYIAAMILLYALSKLCELFDFQIYDAVGQLVSGHTLKHLIAAVATACVIPMWRSGLKPAG